jgi:CBS-domain-containing membrane protein
MSAGQQALKGVSVGEAMETRFTPVSIDANLGQAVEALLATAQHEFPVVDAFAKPVGLLTREDILSAVREHGRDEPASGFMRSDVESVRPSTPVESLFERLQDRSAAALYVTDADGKIIGLLTRQALGEVMMIRAARPDWRFDRKA